jgi:uncharacterized protein YgfB (UPF0149 family)
MTAPVLYDDLDSALRRCGSSWNAGQAHGLLCSRLALAGAGGADAWRTMVLDNADLDDPQVRECAAMLEQLTIETYRQLSERQSEFEPLLPADDTPTTARAGSMAQWCEGFLHGLVSNAEGAKLKKRLADEPLSEIIKDLLEITRAVADDSGDIEADEKAYWELFEYLRVATQLTYEELAEFRPATAASGDPVTRILH